MEFMILLTNPVRLDIISIKKENERNILIKFFDFLFSGDWLVRPFNGNNLKIWKDPESEEFLISFQLKKDFFIILEPVFTINIIDYLSNIRFADVEPDIFIKPFAIIHSVGSFPGNPDQQLFLPGREPYSEYQGDMTVGQIIELYRRRDLSYNEELYVLGPINFKDFILGNREGLMLYMTPEQAKVLGFHRDQPILLSGEAGSGKTIVMTHWLAINWHLEKKPKQLFVTFSERLVNKTKEDFEIMLKPKYQYNHNVEFMTYRHLLWDRIHNLYGLRVFKLKNEMTFERFMREYSIKIPHNLDPILVWDEIRSVIKGSLIDDESTSLISLDDYKKLNEERGQCKVPDSLRELYYDAAVAYQKYLNENNLWDSIDLAKHCINVLKAHKTLPFIYDKIACDEVQDLAPVEIQLLILLLKDKAIENMFITGDTAQVINPSGFSWNLLKGLLGRTMDRKGIKDPIYLHRNFRCSKEIVELVNYILLIREEILQDMGEKNRQESSKKTGVLPMLLKEDPLEVLKKETSNPQTRLILVKTKEVKEGLEEILMDVWGDERRATILTVEEAKGLEWKVVLLYNFFIPRHETISRNDWEDIFIPEKREALPDSYAKGRKNKYGLSYEFNLLHVAKTRARDRLFIYDDDEQFNLKKFSQDFEKLNELIEEIPIERYRVEWKTELPAADELEKAANRVEEKDSRQANFFYKQAARAWQKAGMFYHAAQCWEKSQEYARAADCYHKDGRRSDELEMWSKHYKELEDYKREGEVWKEYFNFHISTDGERGKIYKGFENAKIAFIKAKEGDKAAEVLEKKAEFYKSVDKVEWISAIGDAAMQWEKVGNIERALNLFSIIFSNRGLINEYKDEYIKEEKIQKWFAKKLTLSAKINEEQNRLIDAAEVMDGACKIWDAMAEETQNEEEKIHFLSELKKCIELVSKYKIMLNDYEGARRILKDFIEKLKEANQIDLCIDCYNTLINLSKDNKKTLELEEDIDNAYNFFIYNKKSTEKLLSNAKKWFKEHDVKKQEYNMIKKLIIFYRKDKEEKREYQDKYLSYSIEAIDLALELDNYREAVETCLDLGKNYLFKHNYEDASNIFERGLKIFIEYDVGFTTLGWYCFNDVAIENFVIMNVDWNCYKDDLGLNQVIYWVKKAIKYFERNPTNAFIRLNKFKTKNDKFRSVWAEYIELKLIASRVEKIDPKDPSFVKHRKEVIEDIKDIISGNDEILKYLEIMFLQARPEQRIFPSIMKEIKDEINKFDEKLKKIQEIQ